VIGCHSLGTTFAGLFDEWSVIGVWDKSPTTNHSGANHR
jgi:hypothetical protein